MNSEDLVYGTILIFGLFVLGSILTLTGIGLVEVTTNGRASRIYAACEYQGYYNVNETKVIHCETMKKDTK